MEILNVAKTKAPPQPPAELTHIDVRLTVDEVAFLHLVLGAMPSRVASRFLLHNTKSVAHIQVGLSRVLEGTRAASDAIPGVLALVPSTSKVNPSGDAITTDSTVTVDNVTYSTTEAAAEIKAMRDALAQIKRIATAP